MSLGKLVGNGLSALRRLWSPRPAGATARRQRRGEFKRLLVESLEGRDLLAADFLYSLEARQGAPDEGFGFAVAANDQFHVVSNFAPNLTYYYLEEQPDLESFFYGEIQVHDATTGELLRTIQNPFPYGRGDFGYYSDEFNFALERPNSFGYSIDIFENLILVGSPGWEGDFDIPPEQGDHDTGGRAFLFDAETGDLLHTFDGSYFPQAPGGQPGQSPGGGNNDGFGRSVSIDGNRIAIGAHGPSYEDVEKTIHDIDPGRVYIYSATTGNLLHLLESPDPSPVETLDFGATVSLSNGRLVVTEGDQFFTEWQSEYEFGPVRVYDVQTGDLLHTLPVDGFEADIEGDNIVIGELPGITHFANATTGIITQTISAPLYDFDGNLLVTGNSGFVNVPFQIAIRDFPSGVVLYSVPQPPGYADAVWAFNGARVFEDRLLIPSRHGLATENFVLVYSVTNGPANGPPTDIALTNNSVPENSANGTVIGTLSATDPDPGDTFTFELINSSGGRFALNGNQVVVADGSLLDFEADSTHPIVVHVTDSAGNVFGEILTIQVTNIHEPTDIALSPNSVPENSASGTVVGTLTATDLDPGETFTFELLSTAGGRFALDGDQIVVANGSALDYESLPFHTVNVQVTDSSGNTYSEGQLILVTNANEPITDLFLLDHKVVEQSPNGALVGAIDNPAPRTDDYFGAMAADASHLLVASYFAPEAYIFDADTFSLLHTLPNPNLNTDFIGAEVAISATHAVVGNSLDQTAGPGAGAVHIYNVNTGVLQQTLYSPINTTGFFGDSVAIFGNRLAVGSSLGSGRVFVFELSTGNLLHTLANPQGNHTSFGNAVAMTASQIIVGQSSTGAGAAHVYDAATGVFQYSISNPTPETADQFGIEIRAIGSRILIGASSDNTAGADVGAAYLFDAATGTLLHTFLPTGNAAGAAYGFTLDLYSSRIAIGSIFGARTYLYSATTFDLIQELPDVHIGNEKFGVHLDFGGERLFVGDQANRGVMHAGEIQVFDATTGDLLPGFRVVDQDEADTYTYTLLDNAGGRFALSGDQLVVANGAAIDFETAASHTVTVQVTDTGGSSLTKTLTIDVIDANEPPTNIALGGSTVSESSLRLIHNLNPEPGQVFGSMLAVSGNRMLINEFDASGPQTRPGRVVVMDTATGERIATLVNPNPVSNQLSVDGWFGLDGAISGNLAIVAARSANVGNNVSAGVVYVFNATTGALLHTWSSPTPGSSQLFGQTVAAAGNIIAVGSLDGVQGAGVVYLYNATTGALLTTISNPDPDAAVDFFGAALAFSGNTLVAGVPQEILGGNTAGRAYLYHINPVSFAATFVSTLSNPTPADGEFFGSRVAVAGNLVAVSAIDDAGAAGAGAVYVFDATTGSLLRTITDPFPAANNRLGYSLAIKGQYVIASSRAKNLNTGGAAYVFHATSGELVATISNPSPASLDSFGGQIVVDGNRIVISDPGDDSDGQNQGMVFIYDLPFGQPVGTLSATDPDLGETFSYSLIDNADGRFAIDGNQLVIADATKLDFEAATSHLVTVQVADGGANTFSKDFTVTVTPANEPPQDIVLTGNTVSETQVRFLHNLGPQRIPTFGYATEADGGLVVVGTNNLPSYNLPGEVSVYNNSTGELVSVLAAPSPQADELFGENVAISGNLVVVGARNRNAGVGAAYVYNATTDALLHTLVNPTPASSGTYPDFFGSAVAISGNLIAIGSEEDLGAPDSGAVYLFDAVSGNLLQTIASPVPSVQSKFGNELSLVGNTLVVGASLGNRAYIFEWNSTAQSAALVASLTVPPGGGADSFGGAVTIVGNIVAVGARNSDVGAANSGQVHLFDRATGSFLSSLDNPSPNTDDLFGQFIASNGTHLAVAAQNDDTAAVDSGRVYIFNPATGELLSTIANPSPNGGDFFSRLSFSGNTLIVGAPTDDSDGSNAGMVYLFDLPFTQVVGSLSTTDPDTGSVLTYSLADAAAGRFQLVGNSIAIADPSRFDFESGPTHAVQVRATDPGGLSTVETLLILTANSNEPPRDIAFVGSSVVENAINGVVISTLSATDPDAGSTITYSLNNSAGGRFAIAGNTIIVANASLLDFETATAHTITVRATDNGGKFVLETLKISVSDAAEGLDFGDLPNSFGTTLAVNGARHMISNGLRLGATVAGEADGQPSANANLDSGDDGVILPSILIPGISATFTVTASQAGRLDVFLDALVGDGQFTEDERVTGASGLLLSPGTNFFTLSIGSGGGLSGNRAMRFRVSSVGGLGPTGLAADGEVEDYRINLAGLPVNAVQLLPDPDLPGATLMYVSGSQAADTIVVAPFNGKLRATINGVNKAPLAPLTVSRIVIVGRNGNDDIRINNTGIPGHIDGGGGNDTMRGGNGPDRLYGRAGNDTIYGRAGDDEIFGGIGNDTLYSDAGIGYLFGEDGNDILSGNGVLVGGVGTDKLTGSGARNVLLGGLGKDTITGASANQGELIITGTWQHENNLAALKAIHNEWRKSAPVLTRIDNLKGTTTNGLNGTYFVNPSTVSADAAADVLFNYGSNNVLLNDWIFKSTNDVKPSPLGIVITI